MNGIRLTGRVIDWDQEDYDEVTIEPAEAAEFESKGYMVATIQGHTWAFRKQPPNDGDIQIQPKSDIFGRLAAARGHTNYGFSGYFKGFVYLAGKRRKLVDWWTLFPGKEHQYASQQEKSKTEAAIRTIIETRAETEVVKVKGGYSFQTDGGQPAADNAD
ncbi:hypothetical protein SAMN04488498_12232 [Mesorhizobium albiziae]|uniref:Uncharacterized protein n=1 Tax=Neomesorhizobium albiziae TaxID=335020 RepID=A0A1I4E6D8_9HYPH|nr:hypothetical protein [Mesorhizobium albiziae]GLS32507.1 hypothetical protein GCM10007937_42170 [Mesorhizobium albiziae]SFL00157.1 hypothetical protein SAMN04488498_12232 [Mesorhizobium albiziae]